MSIFPRSALIAALGIAAAGMAGCATPTAPHIYTLQDQGAAPASVAQGGPTRFVDLAPIVLPERLRRRQIVLRSDATRLRVLEQDRWSAALPDELHDVIAVGLQTRLGAVDVSQTGLSGGKAVVYRISVEFSEFDAQLGGEARASVAWAVKEVSGSRGQVCRSRFVEPAGATVETVVAAHQRLVGQVTDAIAASQRAAESGGAAPNCSSAGG